MSHYFIAVDPSKARAVNQALDAICVRAKLFPHSTCWWSAYSERSADSLCELLRSRCGGNVVVAPMDGSLTYL